MNSDSISVSIGSTSNIPLMDTLNVIAIKVSNKSPYDVLYGKFGTQGQEWIAAGTETVLYSYNGNQGVLSLEPFNTVNISPANPAAILYTIYQLGDKLPVGQWPVSIPFQVINVVNTVAATNLINNGGVNPTNIISATPAGKSDQETLMWNNGSAVFGGQNPGDDSGTIELSMVTPLFNVSPPAGTGTVQMYLPFGVPSPIGSVQTCMHRCYLVFNGLRNTSASQYSIDFSLFNAGANGFVIYTTDSPVIEILDNVGGAVTFNVFTSAGNFSTGTTIGKFAWGSGLGKCYKFRFSASDATTHNGITIVDWF